MSSLFGLKRFIVLLHFRVINSQTVAVGRESLELEENPAVFSILLFGDRPTIRESIKGLFFCLSFISLFFFDIFYFPASQQSVELNNRVFK